MHLLLAVGFRPNLQLTGIIALIAGIIILIRPKVLNFVVAIYLIIIGLIQVLHVRA
jgi:uncharacterized membrane protein HdeD (DUF308 family)